MQFVTYVQMLSNILLSRLILYVEEITGDQCAFQHNRSTTDHIFCFCQILEKIWEYNEAVHKFGGRSCIIISMNLVSLQKIVRLIKMCLNETYSRVKAGKHLSGTVPIKNGLKHEMLSHLYFTNLL